jgi:transporter family-2 protein
MHCAGHWWGRACSRCASGRHPEPLAGRFAALEQSSYGRSTDPWRILVTQLAFAALAVLAGIAGSIQPAANSGLAQKIGLAATLVLNSVIVLAAALLYFLARNPHLSWFPAGTPWTYYIGGACGFTVIFCLAFVFPKIGAAWTIALVVLGQGVAALVIDHYGLLGMPKEPATLARLAGLALVAFGCFLVR